VWQRIAIVAAGPIANLLLCILAVGDVRDRQAGLLGHVGQVQGHRRQAGLQRRPHLRVATAVATLGEASMALTAAAMDRRDVSLGVETPDGPGAPRAAAVAAAGGFDERQVRRLAGLYLAIRAAAGAGRVATAARPTGCCSRAT
jgi:regulator of sigma E protease